ncbi:MAG: NYN domain-containing protein [Gemmataceae bacterium]
MVFLIDGYNLMHAVGMLRVGLPKKQFAPARARFLDWLADAARGRPDTLRVVFDAVHGPAPSAEHSHRGLRVRFAFAQTADEQIEELVRARERAEGGGGGVERRAGARGGARRGCGVFTCQGFVDWLIAPPRDPEAPPPPDDKPVPDPTAAEFAEWEAAFSTKKPR